MAFDRESTLKRAERLLRQGRLDAAIAEYERVVEEEPRDWNTANALGDLYARAGKIEQAVDQYSRIAEHFSHDGFYPKAAALYKKILKIKSDDERTQLQLAGVSVRQGLLADAKSLLNAVAARRRLRSDRRGEAEIIVRLGTLDPADIEARRAAARTLETLGQTDEAASAYKALHAELEEKGRTGEALDALREFVRLRPGDPEARGILARAALQSGDLARAKHFVTGDTAAQDPKLLLEFVKAHLAAGDTDAVRPLLPDVLAGGSEIRRSLLELAWRVAATHPAAAVACIEGVVDAMVAASEFREAATALQEFVRRVPGHIGSLLRLVEVCVDGGFETEMYAAQEQLTDAYLAAGQAAEARVIAEDLVAREPWESGHIERFRRALVMLRVSDPDAEIAERLSGQSPFTATDRFAPPLDPRPAEAADAPAPEAPHEHAAFSEPIAAAAPSETAHSQMRPRSPEADADEHDLTHALGGLHHGTEAGPGEPADRDERSLETVFGELREGAAADAEYAARHLMLARTYLEKGLEDEAIPSLESASRSPRLRFEAASVLGRLLLRRGDVPQALEWLERASEAPPPTVEEGRALMYDFGVALDDAGETARALAVFLELQADAGDYRDTPSRIDRLARAQTGG